MDIQQAIAAIQASGIDNAGTIADVVRSAATDLTARTQEVASITQERDRLAENNSELLAQKRTTNRKVSELQEKLSKVMGAIAQDGDDEEAQMTRLTNLAAEVETMKTKHAEETTTLKAERDRAVAMAVSQKLGVDPVLLQRLIPVEPGSYQIADDGVRVRVSDGDGTKELSWSEYLEQQPAPIKDIFQKGQQPESGEGKGKSEGTDRQTAKPTNQGQTPGPSAPPSQPVSKASVNELLAKQGFGLPKKQST